MAFMIKDVEADKLARELARTTGETVSEAVITALRERLEREQHRQNRTVVLAEELLQIGRECAALPVLDDRPAEEIVGYDDFGIPI